MHQLHWIRIDTGNGIVPIGDDLARHETRCSAAVYSGCRRSLLHPTSAAVDCEEVLKRTHIEVPATIGCLKRGTILATDRGLQV